MSNLLTQLRLAISFLTRVPAASKNDGEPGRLADAAWGFPIVGVAVGAGGGGAYLVSDAMGLPATLSALFAVATTCVLTGGLHEDGAADCADGFGGGTTRDAKLAIMRDSRIGSYGVMTLVLGTLARVFAIASLAEPVSVLAATICAGALSRMSAVSVLAHLPFARDDGLAVDFGRPRPRTTWTAIALGASVAFFGLEFAVFLGSLATTAVIVVGMSWLAVRQIGGQTGDVLGAIILAGEIVVLVTVSALA